MSTDHRRHRLIEFAIAAPKAVMWLVGLITVVLAAAMVGITVDTDPENMLPADDPVRVRNEVLRDEFGIRETIVVGVIAADPEGILTDDRLTAVAALHERIADMDGVVADGMISLLTATDAVDDPRAVEAAVAANPLLVDNVISADGTTAAIFVPLESKSDANPVTAAIKTEIAGLAPLESLETHVAGLPLAEEAFGEAMFVQMAIFAPLAGLLVFLLMMWSFRRVRLVLAAMALAMLTVIWTMGLLIGTGNTVHIMSSMIPIFLMPLAILPSIHVLSEFFDRYTHFLDRRATLRAVYDELHRPIAFTSLTTGIGFAALAIAPIPPVRVFGIFVAVGMLFAWLLTMVFLPAYITLINENRLLAQLKSNPERSDPLLANAMRALGRFALRHRIAIPIGFAALALVAIPATTQISVNDNPVNWFKSGSEVRVSTEALNDRLPGTFNANLVIRASEPEALLEPETIEYVRALQQEWEALAVVGSSASYAEVLPGAQDPRDELSAAFAGQPVLMGSLVTPDATAANLRLQLSSGDNHAMNQVVDATSDYLDANPLPAGITADWAGETYLNLVWQDKMVTGMLEAFLSTLVVVVALLMVLFRSWRWALLGILPVAWTILIVYGTIGVTGKDYDMPIAVLSTLVIGIGVDFAIHFVERFRRLCDQFGDRAWAVRAFFEEPARALSRNALVVAIGFTPLFLSSLVPYLVVGAFLSSIIVLSWLTTLLLLPALVGRGDITKTATCDTAAEPEGTVQPA